MQEGTPPSFPSLPCLGPFPKHPFPWMLAAPEEGDVNLISSFPPFPVLQVLQDSSPGSTGEQPSLGTPQGGAVPRADPAGSSWAGAGKGSGARDGALGGLCGVGQCHPVPLSPWVTRGKHKAGQAPGEVRIGC